jgi:hypothetical protein
MKLRDIIKNLDKSVSNQDDGIVYYLDPLLSELSLDFLDVSQDYDNPRLKCYWVANHICTDTWVGYRAYFLDDSFVCLSYQSARKSYEVFQWLSTEAQHLVRDYILSLCSDDFTPNGNILDLDVDFGEGYAVDYVGQLLRKQVLLNGEIVTVIKEDKSNSNFHTIEVRDSVSKEFEVDIRNVRVPWYIV